MSYAHSQAEVFRRDEQGSTLVEFALALPVFLLTLFGAFQTFAALLFYCNAAYACGSAARYASLHSVTSSSPATQSALEAMVLSKVWTGTLATPVVTSSWSPGNQVGAAVTITVAIDLPLPIPFTTVRHIPVSSTATRQVTY